MGTSQARVQTIVVETPRRRYKTMSRVLFTFMAIGMLAMLVVSLLALGTFAKKEKEVVNFYRGYGNRTGLCILYSKYLRLEPKKVVILPHTKGPCVFVLWGLVSVSIAVISTIIYFMLLTLLGAKIATTLRILDLVVSFSLFLLSFIVSIIITTGINETCKATDHDTQVCSLTALRHPGSEDGKELLFYDGVNIAKYGAWAMTVFMFIMTIWNIFMVIYYCSHRRRYI